MSLNQYNRTTVETVISIIQKMQNRIDAAQYHMGIKAYVNDKFNGIR